MRTANNVLCTVGVLQLGIASRRRIDLFGPRRMSLRSPLSVIGRTEAEAFRSVQCCARNPNKSVVLSYPKTQLTINSLLEQKSRAWGRRLDLGLDIQG